MHTDSFDLDRFVHAQENGVYETALKELRGGRKHCHWMWFIFPQLKGLGYSNDANYYGISGKQEALSYLKHPLIGSRLVNCTKVVNSFVNKSVYDVFPHPDELKFFSCMTLFAEVSPLESAFHIALSKYFSGKKDESTIRLLTQFKR